MPVCMQADFLRIRQVLSHEERDAAFANLPPAAAQGNAAEGVLDLQHHRWCRDLLLPLLLCEREGGNINSELRRTNF